MIKSRKPTKKNFLEFYKKYGSTTNTILDVGVQDETWELRHTFPDIKHVLIEPAKDYFEAIVKAYEENPDVEYVWKAASDKIETLYLHTKALDPDRPELVTHTYLSSTLELNEGDNNVYPVETITLDHLCQKNNYPKPYLLKIDVDGTELQILKGARDTLNDVDLLIVEAPLHLLTERAVFIEKNNFILVDIVDMAYMRGIMSQVDMIFINKRIFNEIQKYPEMNPYASGFSCHGNYYEIY